MKALILLGTLKKEELSHTETLCEFLVERMENKGMEAEIVKLVALEIPAGTCTDMGEGDPWPAVYEKIEAAEAVVFATPIWWGGHSSEIQRVIERLDEVHDEIMEGKESALAGKVGGVVITGDSDGAQHVIANVANFMNAIGILLPPHATLSVLSPLQAKGKATPRAELLELYRKDYAKTADAMVDQMLRYGSPEKRSGG